MDIGQHLHRKVLRLAKEGEYISQSARWRDLLSRDEKQEIMELWNQEYPVNLAYNSLPAFEKYINELESPMHILVRLNDRIVGWASKFNRDQARWFAIILASSMQGQGIGSRLMEQIKADESLIYGWVIDHNKDVKTNAEPYLSPLNFYVKNDFEVLLDQRLELPSLSAVKIKWQKDTTLFNLHTL